MRFSRSRGVASRICCVLLALILGPVSQAAPPAVELRVLTWSDYIDPEVVADFEAATGIRLDFIHFDSDETRDDYLVAANGSGYDLILVTGEVWAAQMYSGDALMLQEFNPDIRYVVPEEGTNLWVDFWTVAAQSSRKPAAMKFIDYINEPTVAARNA